MHQKNDKHVKKKKVKNMQNTIGVGFYKNVINRAHLLLDFKQLILINALIHKSVP